MRKAIVILMALVLLTSCAAALAESDDDWMNEDWMDDEWKKEAIAAWAEEREAAKAFTARFSGTLTDEDLLTFVMLNDETRIVLGKTTPRELLKEGYILSSAADGVFALVSKYGEDTGVYLYTENGGNNEPIMEMDAMSQEFMEVGYCGFDGTVGIHADDPDEYWYPDETGLKLGGLLAETGERIDLWDGLVNWLVTDYGARQSEEGIYEAKITLSDGRALYVASHDSQVRISLLGPCTEVTAGMETAASVPSYLTPSVFVSKYNSMIDAVAEVYADQLGEEGVQILKEQYKITEVDTSMGELVYYGSPEWEIEAGFVYADGTEPTGDTPARLLNFNIKTGIPDGAVEIATYIFRMIVSYEYQDDAVTEALLDWFRTVESPENVFELPGYTLNAFFSQNFRQYAILPSDSAYREEVMNELEQQESAR